MDIVFIIFDWGIVIWLGCLIIELVFFYVYSNFIWVVIEGYIVILVLLVGLINIFEI